MSDEVALELENIAGNSDTGYEPSEKKVSYRDRFKSLIYSNEAEYDDKKSWWDAVEACIKKDDDFRERVSRKAGQAEGGGEGEKPRKQAIIEVMVDLLLEFEEIHMSLSKALKYTFSLTGTRRHINYPRDFMAKELLKRGADPNEETKSFGGRTPLHMVVSCRDTGRSEDLLKLLLKKGALVNKCRGTTPLYTAAYEGHVGMVKLLTENGADLHAKSSSGIESALHAAVRWPLREARAVEIVKLLCDLGVSVEVENRYGMRPLHIAAMGGWIECVEALVHEGN